MNNSVFEPIEHKIMAPAKIFVIPVSQKSAFLGRKDSPRQCEKIVTGGAGPRFPGILGGHPRDSNKRPAAGPPG